MHGTRHCFYRSSVQFVVLGIYGISSSETDVAMLRAGLRWREGGMGIDNLLFVHLSLWFTEGI